MSHDVVVVGSLNQDLTVRTPHLPVPGETVLGSGHSFGLGGKGANQAVAAARLERSVAMVGLVGADQAGREMLDRLAEEGVDISAISTDAEAHTGLAVIAVDDRGENSIVVSPGANARLTPLDIEASRATIEDATVLLLQLEVPLQAVIAAASLANGTVVLNPAPAQTLPIELIEATDVIVPNRSELAVLAGVDEPASLSDVMTASRAFLTDRTLVVTLGADGAVVIRDGEATPVSAPRVTPVDTTGAGDAFCGALADALSRGIGLETSVTWAAAAGAVAATRAGAQGAMPNRNDVEALLGF